MTLNQVLQAVYFATRCTRRAHHASFMSEKTVYVEIEGGLSSEQLAVLRSITPEDVVVLVVDAKAPF